MSRAKISLLAANCTIHSLARPRILARLLARRYDVDVVAPLFPGDDDVYAPSIWPEGCRYIPVKVRPFPDFARSVGDLMDALTGKAVYACKPKATSLGVALMARRRLEVPIVVDVDDREVYHCYPYSYHMSKNLLLSLRQWRHPNAFPLTMMLEGLVPRTDHVTSVSGHFQRLFGGTVIPQAVDTELFDPSRYDRSRVRQQWGLNDLKVVLFLGRPQPHKGLEEMLQAIRGCGDPAARLVVVGGRTPYLETLLGDDRLVYLGLQPFERGPEFLAAADVVMVPQRLNPISMGQMPTKIPEAMAMGIPLIVSEVADMVDQVADAGITVPSGDVAALTRALRRVLGDPELARGMGATGRRRAVEKYSIEAVRPTMEWVFGRYVG